MGPTVIANNAKQPANGPPSISAYYFGYFPTLSVNIKVYVAVKFLEIAFSNKKQIIINQICNQARLTLIRLIGSEITHLQVAGSTVNAHFMTKITGSDENRIITV